MGQPSNPQQPALRRSPRAGGYTLVELLAVVLILGMLTVLAGPILLRRLRPDPLGEASTALRQAQAEVRRLAVGSGARLDLRVDGLAWSGPAGLGVAYRCPTAVAVSWHGVEPALPLSTLTIDDHGRSPDVMVTITSGADSATWLVSGLSGAWIAPEEQR